MVVSTRTTPPQICCRLSAQILLPLYYPLLPTDRLSLASLGQTIPCFHRKDYPLLPTNRLSLASHEQTIPCFPRTDYPLLPTDRLSPASYEQTISVFRVLLSTKLSLVKGYYIAYSLQMSDDRWCSGKTMLRMLGNLFSFLLYATCRYSRCCETS